MKQILIIVGILCFFYYAVIVLYAGITADFAWIWPFAGVCCLIFRCLLVYGEKSGGAFGKVLTWGIRAVLVTGILFLAAGSVLVCRGMWAKHTGHLDYIVVLGAQVKGDKPSRALKKRLDCALSYGKRDDDTILILSGGQGPGEMITEAECMRRYLTAHGLDEKQLVLESRSTNTKENLIFSAELTDCDEKRTGILSNNFHVYRAVRLAQKQNYRNPVGIPAASDPVMQVHYVIREVFALFKEKMKGNI